MNKEYTIGLISVIIPTYKRSDMLTRAIDSVLNQTYKQIELIIINDNNIGDNYSIQLYKLLSRYNDSRLHLLEQEVHINGAVARNVGIKAAHGEYIAFLDDDDYWEDNKLELQLNVLKNLDESWGGITCLKKYVRNNEYYRASIPYKDGDIFESVLLLLTDVTTGTVLLRHSALDKAGYFDEKLLRSQDIQLFAYFTKKYKIKLLPKHLLIVDASDNQNRPSVGKLKEIRMAYANSVDCLISDNQKLKRKLYLHIECGVGISLIRSGKIFKGSIGVIKSLKSPSVLFSQVKMYFVNVCEFLLSKHYLKKYS